MDEFLQKIKESDFLKQRLGVNEVDYQHAVHTLVKVSHSDSGQSQVTRTVLLAAYDSSTYPLDISELGRLDYPLLEAALIVIRGRIVNGWEPHEVIDNGNRIFQALIGN